MSFKVESFKGHEFKVVRGETHPEFSYYTFEEEEKEIREQYWNIKPGEVVVDVGASYGSYTLTACAMGAQVYAFEPEPTVYADLVRNLELNGWLYTRCTPFNLGLWSVQGIVSMKSYAPHWPQHTISGDYNMTTLDNLVGIDQPKRVDWLKVDVEGAEVPVLVGGLETLRRFHPRLLVECHVFLDKEILEKIEALLIPLDYRLEEIERPPCVMLYAR